MAKVGRSGVAGHLFAVMGLTACRLKFWLPAVRLALVFLYRRRKCVVDSLFLFGKPSVSSLRPQGNDALDICRRLCKQGLKSHFSAPDRPEVEQGFQPVDQVIKCRSDGLKY